MSYELQIISRQPEFSGRNLKKYNVEGIDTVGVWGNEPFEIQFKNNTWSKVQVKLSLDGTDILTGQTASTDVNGKMWVVEAQKTLTLKAWPESTHGGSAFIFTHAGSSVAAHTHGDTSSQGIIAAAVYVESYVAPITYYHVQTLPYWYDRYYWGVGDYTITCGSTTFNGDITNQVVSYNSCVSNSIGASSSSFNCSVDAGSAAAFTDQNYLQSSAGIGAGQYTQQEIHNATGLVKPALSTTVRVKYLWWDDLRSKLSKYNVAMPQASGFPGDNNQQFINLGSTPRINAGSNYTAPVQQNYARF